MPELRIATPDGFAFQHAVVSHGWYHLAPFRWDGTSLHRTELLDADAIDLVIRRDGASLVVRSREPLRPHRVRLEQRLSRMFQLQLDLEDFHARCRRSPANAVVAEQGYGRLLCGSTLFEDIVKIIATTNTTWAQTVRMTGLLVDRCGTRSASGTAAFPEPAAVAAVPASDLQEECRLGYRAKSIHTLASGIVDGTIDLAKVADQEQTTAELFKSYQQLPGIGPYGAAHLLAMDGRHDFIAVDTEFRRFVRERYHHGRKVSDKTMVRRYASWGRWQYLAFWSELWNELTKIDKRVKDGAQ